MRLNGWYALMAAATLLWHECGSDLSVFCYRIGCGVLFAAGERALELVPVRAAMNQVRTNTACSNRFFTSYVRSTTPRD